MRETVVGVFKVPRLVVVLKARLVPSRRPSPLRPNLLLKVGDEPIKPELSAILNATVYEVGRGPLKREARGGADNDENGGGDALTLW